MARLRIRRAGRAVRLRLHTARAKLPRRRRRGDRLPGALMGKTGELRTRPQPPAAGCASSMKRSPLLLDPKALGESDEAVRRWQVALHGLMEADAHRVVVRE